MGRIDPAIRVSATTALRRMADSDGRISWNVVCRVAELHDVAVHTVYRWSRALAAGESPEVDKRVVRKAREFAPEVLTLIAHHATLGAAHRAAVGDGLYAGSYRQFLRDVDALPPAVRAGLQDGRDGLVARMPTMSYPLVGRNETWVLDHTMSDVRVLATRSNRLLRPWVSILKDKATGVVLAIHVSDDKTRATDVVGLLAAAMLQQTGLGGDTPVGGRPESLLCDNGAENMADIIVRGAALLGIAMLPTTPGHSWQNGSAENINRLYQDQCESTLPGYVRGGKAVDGGLRFTENTYKQENPDKLLTLDGLTARAVAWAKTYNTTPGKDRRSPLQRWNDDDAEPIVPVTDDEVTLAMSVSGNKYAVTKNGIYFRNHEYQAGFTANYVGRGKVLTIRYLPGVTDWIDCYDDGRKVGRAYLKAMLPRSEQSVIIRARQAMTAKVRTAEQESVRMRQAEAIGDTPDDPVSPTERRHPHGQKRADKAIGYGGGAQSARDAKRMSEHQSAAIARFGDLDLPLTRDDETCGEDGAE